MKTILFWQLAFLLSAPSLLAQPSSISPNLYKLEKYIQIEVNQAVVANYEATNGMSEIDLQKVKDGYNHIATDARNGRELYLFAKRSGGQIRVTGFGVRECTAKWINMYSRSTDSDDAGSRIREGSNPIVSYTHPAYPVSIRYTRCSPVRLRLQLPTAGL